MRAITVDTTLGLGSPDYRTRVLDRLTAGVDIDRHTGCWIWNRAASRDGHGLVHFRGRLRPAHWVAYVLLVAPLDVDQHLDHTCHTPRCRRDVCRHLRCVNPQHLTER